MKKIHSFLTASLIALALAASPAHATNTSTINPNNPAQGSALSSAVLRANFLAAYNDINTAFAQIAAAVTAQITSLSGDVTTTTPVSGVAAATVTHVNGVQYNASPAANTVAVVTNASNGGSTTYESVPNAALQNSSFTIAGHSISLGGTQALQASDLSNGASGSGAIVLASGSAIALGSATGLPLTSGVAGTLPIANGGSNSTTGFGALDSFNGTSSTATNYLDFQRYYSINNTAAVYAPQNNYAYNNDPKYLPHLRKCMAQVHNGSGRCTLIRVGDSTTIGINAAGVAQWPNAGAYLASYLSSAGIPAYQNSFIGDSAYNGTNVGVTGSRDSVDTRLTLGGFTQAGISTLGGGVFQALNSSAAALQFQASTPVDTCKVFYTAYTTGPTGAAQLGSGSSVTMNEGTTGGVVSATATNTLGVNPCKVTYTSGSGSLYVLGFETYDSTQPGIDVIDAGWWGSNTNQIVGTTNFYSSLNALVAIAPNVAILKMDINDAQQTTVAQFKANLISFITAVQAAGTDVIFESDNPANGVTLTAYQDTFYNVAATYNVPVIDTYSIWGSWATANGLGFMSDAFHPYSIGYADWAVQEARTILSVAGGGAAQASSSTPITFDINQIERARITAAGNVGIGTAVPSTLLEVNGTAKVDGALTAASSVALSPASANVVISPTGTGVVTINPATLGTMDNVRIGSTTPAVGAFTTISASNTVSGTGFSTYLASPPAIGGTAAAAGTFSSFALSSAGYSGLTWTTTSPVDNIPALSLADTSGSGVIASKAAVTINAPTFTSTSAQTVTALSTLYVAAPVASTNVTASNSYAINAAGYIYSALGFNGGANYFNLIYTSGGKLWFSSAVPTISSGFNGATVIAGNSASFDVTVGSGTAGSTGAVTLPAATAAWNCHAQDVTTPSNIKMTAHTTTLATFTNYNFAGTATNFTNGDDIAISCFGH